MRKSAAGSARPSACGRAEMESADFAERFNGWKITERQITEIKASNAQAIAAFISDNENRLRHMATAYLWKRRGMQRYAGLETDDLLNQLFVDLPRFCFKDGRGLWYSVRRCFAYTDIGGLCAVHSCEPACFRSLDEPLQETDERTLAAVIPDRSPSPLERMEQAESIEERAPEIFACLSDLIGRRKTATRYKARDLRAVVEYVFAGYSYIQIKRLAGV